MSSARERAQRRRRAVRLDARKDDAPKVRHHRYATSARATVVDEAGVDDDGIAPPVPRAHRRPVRPRLAEHQRAERARRRPRPPLAHACGCARARATRRRRRALRRLRGAQRARSAPPAAGSRRAALRRRCKQLPRPAVHPADASYRRSAADRARARGGGNVQCGACGWCGCRSTKTPLRPDMVALRVETWTRNALTLLVLRPPCTPSTMGHGAPGGLGSLHARTVKMTSETTGSTGCTGIAREWGAAARKINGEIRGNQGLQRTAALRRLRGCRRRERGGGAAARGGGHLARVVADRHRGDRRLRRVDVVRTLPRLPAAFANFWAYAMPRASSLAAVSTSIGLVELAVLALAERAQLSSTTRSCSRGGAAAREKNCAELRASENRARLRGAAHSDDGRRRHSRSARGTSSRGG